MPVTLSIDVVKISNNDFRVIYKNCSIITRQKFVDKQEVLEFLQSKISTADIFVSNKED